MKLCQDFYYILCILYKNHHFKMLYLDIILQIQYFVAELIVDKTLN